MPVSTLMANRGSALPSAAKSKRSHYQSEVFVCVSVISWRIRIIARMRSIAVLISWSNCLRMMNIISVLKYECFTLKGVLFISDGASTLFFKGQRLNRVVLTLIHILRTPENFNRCSMLSMPFKLQYFVFGVRADPAATKLVCFFVNLYEG